MSRDAALVESIVDTARSAIDAYAEDPVDVLDRVIAVLSGDRARHGAESLPAALALCEHGYGIELDCGDWIHADDAGIEGCDTTEPREVEDVRASSIDRGDVFREYGMDEWHHVALDPGGEGDTLVFTTAEEATVYLDRDTTVERVILR